jgi:hypothetical protein
VRHINAVILPGGNTSMTAISRLAPCDAIYIDNQNIYHICTQYDVKSELCTVYSSNEIQLATEKKQM